MRGWAVSLMMVLSSASCASQQAAEVAGRLTGADWKLVDRCLGEPHERDFEDGGRREFWSYRFRGFGRSETLIDLTGSGGQQAAGVRMSSSGQPSETPGFCSYAFVIDDGAITSVDAKGRDAQGMNADTRCMRKLRRCVPDRGPLR